MTTRLPPGVELYGAKGGLVADSDWGGSDEIPAFLDNSYVVPKTVSDQLSTDSDLGES